MKQTYIHYGSKEFDPGSFMPIYNLPFFTKPSGGLWGSPVGSDSGWKDWCESEQFRDCTESNSFLFQLKDTANVLEISSIDSLLTLPKIIRDDFLKGFISWDCLDFEQLLNDGVDAIEVKISNDYRLYYRLYGWDCDSILVMNKDVIIPPRRYDIINHGGTHETVLDLKNI